MIRDRGRVRRQLWQVLEDMTAKTQSELGPDVEGNISLVSPTPVRDKPKLHVEALGRTMGLTKPNRNSCLGRTLRHPGFRSRHQAIAQTPPLVGISSLHLVDQRDPLTRCPLQ